MTKKNYQYFRSSGAPIKAWIKGVQIDDAARRQLENVAALPFVFKHVAAMPDVHWGMGATIGSVIPTRGAIVPAAVGVDIGCGMMAVETSLTSDRLPDSLAGLRARIERAVPHGRTDHGGANDRGAWRDVPAAIAGYDWGQARLSTILDKHDGLAKSGRRPKVKWTPERAARHLGTLGTGNHFIEICLDQNDRVWAMLHSGSRGIGNRIGTYFIERAKREMAKWFIRLPDNDLAYLPEGSALFDDYVEAVGWAQNFAAVNREAMMAAVLEALAAELGEFRAEGMAVNCHHNYVAREHHFGENVWLTRKGAVRARAGDLGIIPGSMGARSYIVRGKGNPESFHSCSHGAGRAMSRGAAKKRFSLADHAAATADVECRKDADVIDETPGAYKDIDAVMAAQADLVEIVHTLKQVVCVKG